MTGTATLYCVILQHQSGNQTVHRFDSMIARSLFVIGLTPFTTVIREWEE